MTGIFAAHTRRLVWALFVSWESLSYEKKIRGPLKRPRSGARVRLAGLFVCDKKTQEELKMKFNVKKLVVSGMLTALAVALSTFSVPIGRRNVSRFSTW